MPVSAHNLANVDFDDQYTFSLATRRCLMSGGESQLVLSHIMQI